MAPAPIRWIFDELPPSGARRGGQAAEHAFGHQLGSFVREVCQNANDQALGAAQIAFELVELEGESLAAFFEAVHWPALRDHLAGAGQTPTPSGRRLAEFLSELETSDRLLALRIEDRGTVGLTGDEDGEGSHFRALCKDTLFSVKQSDSAGGSYGLGKSVLWSFSGLSTVLFSSQLSEDPKGRRSPRLIGRAELPYHEVNGEGFTGPGWFGRAVELDGDRRRAESVWSKQAQRLAQRLALERSEAAGTSVLVLGFREPAAEQQLQPAELTAKLREHAAQWFWPAMQPDQRGLEIQVGGAPVDAADLPELAPFVDCWRRRDHAKPTLERAGDVARVPVAIELPRPRVGGKRIRGTVDLIVRLADDDEPHARTLACFRGAGMVVAYRDLAGMSGLRPFHAILACGRGRDPSDPTHEDLAIERFLRDAEPPGHDSWHATPAVKDMWTRGYGQVFSRLWDGVGAALRELLAPVAAAGVQGPERLRKRFALGRTGRSASKGPSAFHFREFQAQLDGDIWRFAGTIEPDLGARPWRATLCLHHVGEDGAPVGELAIATLHTEPELPVDLHGGNAEVEVPLGVLSLAVTGSAEPTRTELLGAELGLRVFGELQEPPP
ncbi:hypothetical protein DB30_03822 [Enhygromyxa salina]|uniref:Uncharacterized protein n=1 Tax=Enhygromyxa salina TaxID=215803 RepID=A0A0C2D827_9BACT|nr:hypothetical protein [Enhygromyxa salina]KIG19266.1 hypothetical protein DB30_03822 [Enhygromyxa salina]